LGAGERRGGRLFSCQALVYFPCAQTPITHLHTNKKHANTHTHTHTHLLPCQWGTIKHTRKTLRCKYENMQMQFCFKC